MLIWATELIGLMFAVFVAIIAMARMIRAMRKVDELRARQRMEVDTDEPQIRRPSDDYHDAIWLPLCKRAEVAVEARLGRKISQVERLRIWKARTALALEVLIKEAENSAAMGEVAAALANLPSGLDRPDPTGWCLREE
jgi:hypothetical protein